jgi:hypothetical protein
MPPGRKYDDLLAGKQITTGNRVRPVATHNREAAFGHAIAHADGHFFILLFQALS